MTEASEGSSGIRGIISKIIHVTMGPVILRDVTCSSTSTTINGDVPSGSRDAKTNWKQFFLGLGMCVGAIVVGAGIRTGLAFLTAVSLGAAVPLIVAEIGVEGLIVWKAINTMRAAFPRK